MTNPTNPKDVTSPTVLAVHNGQVREAAGRMADQVSARPGGLGGAEVRLDLAAVEYVESRELGALVVLNRKVNGAGGRLALVGVRPGVAGVLSVTRLDTILDVRTAVA